MMLILDRLALGKKNHMRVNIMLSTRHSTSGGGAGFFLACKDFGRMFDHSFPAYAILFSFFFSEVEISICTPIPLFMPGSVHSGSVS